MKPCFETDIRTITKSNKMKKLFIPILDIIFAGCISNKKTQIPDCKGRTDIPTSAFFNDSTGHNISELICDCLKEENVPVIQITVIDSVQNIWTLTTGSADRKGSQRASDDSQFRLASITKPFIAALIFKLIEMNMINLETNISEYFPQHINAGKVKIKHLLNHSSGIEDLFSLPEIIPASVSNPAKIWDPSTVAANVLDNELKFEPGTDNQYSNSNYLLLGLIARKSTGKELNKLLNDLIFAPAGLTGFTFHPIDKTPTELVSGYDREFIKKPEYYELKGENTSFSSAVYAAGNMVANSRQTALFFHSLFNGQIISPASISHMTTFTTAVNPYNEYFSRFGNGLFEYNLNNETYVGHEGQFIGFDHIVVHHPVRKMTIAILSNVSVFEKYKLLKAILIKLS
jgi:D-alanyl-D-alanine carboxypeptidase